MALNRDTTNLSLLGHLAPPAEVASACPLRTALTQMAPPPTTQHASVGPWHAQRQLACVVTNHKIFVQPNHHAQQQMDQPPTLASADVELPDARPVLVCIATNQKMSAPDHLARPRMAPLPTRSRANAATLHAHPPPV